jgi:8-oxo-dGTP pyrophosphatase MutT (NUDIX family)
MGTTAIFAEILITGLEGLVWIGLLVASILGITSVDLAGIGDVETLALFLLVAAAYPVGVLVDRAADWILTAVDRRFDRRVKAFRVQPVVPVHLMRLRLMAPDLGVSTFLDYQRSRVRVARGTVLNLAATVVAGDVFLGSRTAAFAGASGVLLFVVANLMAAAILVGGYVLYRGISGAWLKRVNDAYRMLVPADERQADGGDAAAPRRERPRVVAAVAYRVRSGCVEFLLVRTKDGDNWTFPKGHVERGEDPRAAVLRELGEEAGATGPVDQDALTTYRYPPSRRGATEDSDIAAYLVAVEDEGRAAERRERGWFGEAEARSRLAAGRSPDHAAEAGRVIEAALAALAPRQAAG